MTKYEKEIESLSWTVDDSDFFKISRFFLGISKHPDETNVSKTYLTKDSIMDNCKLYFGHQCNFFSLRLYSILSSNVVMRRISFMDFIDKFYNVMIRRENSNRLKSTFVF
jgi:hypothetical protein